MSVVTPFVSGSSNNATNESTRDAAPVAKAALPLEFPSDGWIIYGAATRFTTLGTYSVQRAMTIVSARKILDPASDAIAHGMASMVGSDNGLSED